MKRRITRECQKNRFNTAKNIAKNLLADFHAVSSPVVRKTLNSNGFKARKPAKKPLLLPRHQQARLVWAREVQSWGLNEWEQVIFSDEAKFCLDGSEGAIYVRRRRGERYKSECVIPTRKFGGGSLMVWAFISAHGDRKIVKIDGKLTGAGYKEILKANWRYPPNTLILQDDNDPKHRCRIVKAFKQTKKILSLEWPANSPDLNIIEQIWQEMKRRIKRNQDMTVNDLWDQIEKTFYEIEDSYINSLFSSLPRRIKAVIRAKGSYTKY